MIRRNLAVVTGRQSAVPGDVDRAMGERSIGWATSFWLLICASLAAVVVLEVSSSLPLAPQVTAAAPTVMPEAEPAAPRFEPPPPGAFDEIALRPLFFESRRPFVPSPEAETVDVPVTDEAAVLELVGTLVTDQNRAALLQPAGQSASWRREGDKIAGWQIGSIEPDRVTLRQGDQIETLELRADLPGPARTERAGGKRTRDKQQQARATDSSQN